MSRRKFGAFSYSKIFAPAIAAVGVVTLSTMNACTPSDRSTASHEAVVTQNALDAEHAEEMLGKEAEAVEAPKFVKMEVPAKKEEVKKDPAKQETAVSSKKPKLTPPATESANQLASRELKVVSEVSRKPAAAGGVFVVQVGAFRVKENAEKLHAKLLSAGFKVDLKTIEHSKNGLLHVVRFEGTQDRAEAETKVLELRTKQEMSAQILKLSADN